MLFSIALAPALAFLAHAAELAPPAPAPEAHGQKWLVLLSAKVERGHVPPGLARAAAVPGTRLVRLDSSAYKNLMPCYEIVVAGSFVDVAQARALAGQLQAVGVETALKHSGVFVGPRPELERACATLADPPPASGQVAFGGELGVAVSLPPEVATRALQDAGPLVSRSETAWSAPLPAQTVGTWSVGSAVSAWSYDEGPLDCAVTGFAAGVEGTAHFGWRAAGLSAPPPCGEPRVTATLSCSPDVVAPPGTELTVARWTAPWGPSWPPGLWPAAAKLEADVRAQVSSDTKVYVEWSRRAATLQDRQLWVYVLKITTGDGEWVCGGPDFMSTHVGVADREGAAWGGLTETTGADVVGLLVPADGGAPWVDTVDIITGSHRVVRDGAVVAEHPRGYCDCPC